MKKRLYNTIQIWKSNTVTLNLTMALSFGQCEKVFMMFEIIRRFDSCALLAFQLCTWLFQLIWKCQSRGASGISISFLQPHDLHWNPQVLTFSPLFSFFFHILKSTETQKSPQFSWWDASKENYLIERLFLTPLLAPTERTFKLCPQLNVLAFKLGQIEVLQCSTDQLTWKADTLNASQNCQSEGISCGWSVGCGCDPKSSRDLLLPSWALQASPSASSARAATDIYTSNYLPTLSSNISTGHKHLSWSSYHFPPKKVTWNTIKTRDFWTFVEISVVGS